jgi:NAD(P)-dependent dehydrogenase (short-subunit alcohol dehydrogenase family)
MAGRLAGKTAFVTGAASGIGRQVALRFHNEGARVAFADRDYDGAKAAVSGRGERARAVEVDIADEDSVTTADAIVINDGWRPSSRCLPTTLTLTTPSSAGSQWGVPERRKTWKA